MKSYSASFLETLNSEVNCLVTCWQIELSNGDRFGFTDCDRPLTIDGITYQADGGFEASDVSRGLGTEDSNSISMRSYFSSTLPESVLTSGQVRSAKVFIFRVNPYELPDTLEDSPLTYDPLVRGNINALELTDQTYIASLSGLKNLLSRTSGWMTQPTCRNSFCDVGSNQILCGLNISDYTDSRTVTEVINPTLIQFGASVPDNYYAGGKIVWQTGDNLGLETACIYSNGQRIKLSDRMPNAIAVGDTFTITQTCGKSFANCHQYGNIAHFNGEPKIPGQDAIASLAPQTNPG